MFSIGDLSKRCQVKIPTIRYYEDMGLIAKPERSEGNQRRYTQKGLERLSFIRHARELGLSINDIRELTALEEDPDRPCIEAHEIAKHHLSEVKSRIQKLRKLENELKRITQISDKTCIGKCQVIHSLADHALCRGEH
ncbi:helix-turn-helix domain-containing protein [Lentilitoribacter sp. Alg239-R112]|uniref:MerR family transcriptional regulator n=1 Tax=Lentilitoribacter sp. Alg239-R112 TaxID=2305987 RepID=UPI0013A693F3|nr:helix-turn-helix domain-containing protein [Lentilitoribacter sp. Alg239-R112]